MCALALPSFKVVPQRTASRIQSSRQTTRIQTTVKFKDQMGVMDERTPLRKAEGGGPPYMFMTNPNRLYRKQIHQFQCLICLSFLLLFATAIVITVLQSVENDVIDNNLDNSSSVEPLLSLSWPIKDKDIGTWKSSIDDNTLNSALSSAQMSLAAKDMLEENMDSLPPDSPSFKHQRSVKTSLRATYLARTGYMLDVATKNVLKSSPEKTNDKSIGRSSTLKNSILPLDVCNFEKEKPKCPSSSYRTVDGTCNNLDNADTWGVAMQPFRRALPPDYADGISAPRKASDGSDLPSAREVSISVHRPEYRGDYDFTVMLAVWGQFLDHDITATALSQGKDGGTISCCGKLPSQMHPECFPVSVGPDDPYFKNISCLEFVRSAPAPTCTLGPREQLNQASSYIDGSVIYGNTDELMSSLRSYENGQLRMTKTPDGRTLLPISTDPADGCNNEEENAKGRYCFAAGDPRANENIHLTTIHLIMARQHNSIATQLSAINPNWDDETLYQESRKIVAAQMQHITYNEFLPVLLGDTIMKKLELSSNTAGYNDKYDPTVNPTASNNFAAASFRFAHTLLPGLMSMMKTMDDAEKVELHQLLFDPYKLYSPGYLDSALAGAMNTPLERMDNYFNKELTENLFKQPDKPCGLDLVSLNIQRGRDHGLPGYPAWREHCGLSRPSTFDDLKGYIDEDSLTIMSSLYKSVDDIDLYTGALSEYPTKDGMLGPTFTCLIGDQFKRLKAGDRFWYETNEQPQAFTDAQLNEIRKTSLAGIICNAADAVDTVRSKVMQSLTPDNQQVPCLKIPQPDLTAWSNIYQSEAKINALKMTASFPISAVMGLHVNQVTLESDDGSTWSGKPPVNVDMSVFNGPSVGPTHRLPPTVQWTTTSVTILPTKLTIAGSYSAVSFVFGKPGLFNFTVNQLTGKFSLDADILWNNTDISTTLLNDATFSTSLFFSSRTPKNVTFNIAKKLEFVNVVPPNKKSIPPFTPSGKGPQSAIIVSGNYSLDKSIFYWPGNLTITLPLNVITDPVLQSVNLKTLSADKDASLSKGSEIRALFKVSGGSVTQDFIDGSEEILWNGKIPVTIPVVSPSGAPLPTKRSAVLSITEVVPNVKGTFSIPNFINGAGFNVSWTSGEFNLIIDSLFNTSLVGIIKPGYKYFTKVLLSPVSPKVMDYGLFSWNDLGQYNMTTKMEGLISDSLDAVDSAIPITIVLQGVYSPDKTSFNWFGEGILSVKNVTKFVVNSGIQKKLLSSPVINGPLWSKTAFGGTITGGHAAVKSNGFFGFGLEKTVWSGSLPVTIPVKYLSGNFSSFLFALGVHWSGNLVGNTIAGKFSLPQFTGEWFPYPSIQWTNGSFSFDVQPLWNTSLEGLLLPGANYYSKVFFQGITTPIVNNIPSAPEDILAFSTSQPIGPELSAPIILQGTFSPDKTLFYWTGSFIISFRSGITGVGSVSFVKGKLTSTQKANLGFVLGSSIPSQQLTKLKKPTTVFGAKSKQFGATVVSGNLNVNVDNDTTVHVLTGSLPINIPSNVFQAINFYNYCIPWSGSLSGSVFEGSFSFPNISNNGSELNISWFNGDFKLNVLPLWFTSLDGAFIPGRKYCSNIFFQGNSTSTNKTKSSSVPVNIGSSSPAVFILKGNYSLDQSLFLWGGQVIISFKNASTITPKLTFTLQSMEDDGSTTAEPTKPPRPTKAPRPPKPTKGPKPPKPKKASISFTVVAGSVMAGLEGVNVTNIWDGILPVKMTLDNIVQENSYAPMAAVSWSGIPTATSLEGKFSFPVTIHNGTVAMLKNWIGNFSLQFVTKWSGDMETFVDSRKTYNCRVLFNEFSKKSVLLSSSNGGLQASGDSANQCNIIIVGTYYKKPIYCSILPFMCSDDTIFTWSGEVIMTFVLPPDPVTDSPVPAQNSLYSTELKKLTNVNGTQRKIIGKVLSGTLSAGLSGESKKVLWSGAIPATIPLPVFWAPTTDVVSYDDDKVYGHGAIWSGSIFGTTVHGTFSLPQYTWNGAASSVRWWNGDFSIQVMSLWDTDLGSLITPGLKFNSRVIFRDIANATSLLQLSPSQYEVDSAYKAPLILLGTYSMDRKLFYWTGQFIVVFHNVPDVNLYSY